MATVKKSKKKVIVPICIVLVIAIIAGAIFGVVKSNDGEEVTLYTIATDDIHETVSLTGDVSSGAKKEYKVGTVATVKEVFVNVGDEVKQGDVLATFDTSSLDAQVASLQSAYDDAKDSYNDAVETQKSAKEKANSINKEISKLESRINKLEKQVNKTTTAKTTTKKATTATTTAPSTTSKGQQILSSVLATTTTTKPATTTTTTAPSTTVDDGSPKYAVNATAYPSNIAGTVVGGGVFPRTQSTTLKAIPNSGYIFFGWYTSTTAILAGEDPVSTVNTMNVSYTGRSVLNYYAVFVESTTTSSETTTAPASVNDIVSTLKTLNDNIASITKDVQTMTALTQVVATSISDAISSGQLNSQTIAKLVGEDVTKAIQQGIVDSTKLLVEEDVAVRMIQAAVSSIDFAALAKGVADSDNAKLTGAQIQLAALYAQYEVYNAQSKDTVTDAQKKAVDASKMALDVMKEQQTALAEGWKADFDGVITAVDVTPGASATMVSSGITLENLGKMVVNVSLGEYDLHKVKLGMKATVTTAYGTYEGKVATIAPTATGGSSSSILDSVGSMAGISGLSSLTDSGAGVECTVAIDNPDENITVGFDADVEIETGVYENVTVVPIESIEMEKNGSYVYVYNEEEGTATKTSIKTGAISDTAYQVTDGLKPGDKVVATPSADYEEDTFKVKVVNSKNK